MHLGCLQGCLHSTPVGTECRKLPPRDDVGAILPLDVGALRGNGFSVVLRGTPSFLSLSRSLALSFSLSLARSSCLHLYQRPHPGRVLGGRDGSRTWSSQFELGCQLELGVDTLGLITMTMWIRTGRLSVKFSLSLILGVQAIGQFPVRCLTWNTSSDNTVVVDGIRCWGGLGAVQGERVLY